MNGALLRKELRELLPWGILMATLAFSEVAMLLLEQVDMLPLGRTFPTLNNIETVVYWLVAFAIGTGLAIRERDDATLGFLDGLPVSRSRVFLVKCAVMLALVLAAPIVRVGVMLVLHFLSRESLGAEWHPLLIAQASALQALLVVNGLLLGAALGRLRSLTWLVAGIAAAALLILGDRVPWTAPLNPFSLLDWQWSTAGLRVDPDAVLVQLVAAGAALLIAWHGFVRGGARRARMTERPFAGAAVTLATIGAGVLVLVLVVPRFEPPVGPTGPIGPSGAQTYRFAESPPAQTSTLHYRFSYPAHESEAALELAAKADEIFERVHALLGVPLGEPIDVDASGSLRNTHGTAFFGRIRMRLSSEVDVVLAHETAHVVAERVAGGVTATHWLSSVVLNEGLASWVDAHFRAPGWTRDDRMLTLAALHARRELLVEELAAPAVLDIVRDEGLKYSAGEALIRAVVRVYGESSLPRLLEAFADPSLPSDARGLRLWRAAFQLAGMDLPAVTDELYREVSAYARAHEERIAALPRPRVRLVRSGEAYGVITLVDEVDVEGERARPDVDGGADVSATAAAVEADEGREEERLHELVLRFRPTPDSPLSTFTSVDTSPNRLHWLAPDRIASGRACVQAGVRIGEETLLEPWSCVPLRDAAALNEIQRSD